MTFELHLDKPRTVTFDEGSAARFHEITGIEASCVEAMKTPLVMEGIRRAGTLIWTALDDEARTEISREQLCELLTTPMLSGFAMKTAQGIQAEREAEAA
jgi:hypothetical protein